MAQKNNQLAINGGTPVTKEPFPMWPQFTEQTIQAATEPLRTGKVNYWTGTYGVEFEQKFAAWNGVRFGISTSNGTSALHTALAALGIGPGDEVITPSYTFIASSFCVCQAGAIPVFADVRRETHTIDPASIESKITKKTKAIIPVHLYGIPCDMDAIMDIARRHGLAVVEDCAQAHGALYNGRKVGTIGHAGCFSFCQSKHFTTGGEGGCVITDDEALAWECRSFRDHGYDVKERLRLLELEAKLLYIHNRVGFNYRMTEMQSLIGLCELERLDSWNLKNRRRNGEMLTKALQGSPFVQYLPPHNVDGKVNAFWLYPIVLNLEALTCDKKTFMTALEAEGVPVVFALWPQSYKEKAFREHNGFGAARYPFRDPLTDPKSVRYDQVHCPNAAWLEERTFSFPVHPVYEERHIQMMIEAFFKVAEAYKA
ncbi:MAG TPA: DegT/DnrJ/EryC1/StrS family aminotransferase [Firmicutes bacterium]|nr:DegT/DnrJ/EryC1/StrS family aminotransferase [Bacillota bacterium]